MLQLNQPAEAAAGAAALESARDVPRRVKARKSKGRDALKQRSIDSMGQQACGDNAALFTPLLRQYLSEPHESRYFVNVKEANISLHGIAPFMPPPLRSQAVSNGISLQFWTDPTCGSSIDASLQLDIAGSMGKLVMRYRTVFAAFPLLVVALVVRKQFSLYDRSGKRFF